MSPGIRRVARLGAGLALLLALGWTLDFALLTKMLGQVDLPFWGLAFFASVLSSVGCAWRWARISDRVAVPLRWGSACGIYGEAITLNNVLPGSLIGGDAWRALSLKRRGAALADAAASVVIDRLAGLWLVAALGALGWVLLGAAAPVEGWVARLYGLSLGAILFGLPFLPWFVRRLLSSRPLRTRLREDAQARLHSLLKRQNTFENAWLLALVPSIPVQALAMLSFYFCLRAAGIALDPLTLLLSAGFVFMSLVLPISLAGWGVREAAAIVILAGAGVSAEAAALGAALYGLAATAQAILALPLFLRSRRIDASDRPSAGHSA